MPMITNMRASHRNCARIYSWFIPLYIHTSAHARRDHRIFDSTLQAVPEGQIWVSLAGKWSRIVDRRGYGQEWSWVEFNSGKGAVPVWCRARLRRYDREASLRHIASPRMMATRHTTR